jgi:gamma-glutamyl phosphate reductase
VNNLEADVAEVARRAKEASRELASLPAARRDAALRAAAYAIEQQKLEVLIANSRDCHDASEAVNKGEMSPALFKRLQDKRTRHRNDVARC